MRHCYATPIKKENGMNKTEYAYSVFLDALQSAGEVSKWEFEAVKLRLAKNTFYTPDFLVVTQSRIEFHEVKGFWRDDARVKIKVAAKLFPWFAFFAVKKTKTGWEYEEF